MLRYMISPVIGNGSVESSFRAAVSDVENVNTVSVIPTHVTGPNIGQPKYGFAFCVVATPSVAVIAAVSNAYVFPDYNLDGQMQGMEAASRAAFQQSVEAYNLDGEGLHFDAANTDSESWRTVINRVVKQIEPAFDLQNVSVPEVAA
jgi:hypothetical protein